MNINQFDEHFFEKLLLNCRENAGYIGRIYLINNRETRWFYEALNDIIKDATDGIKFIEYRNLTCLLEFMNGSVIIAEPITNYHRGTHCNEILYQEPISNEILLELSATIVDYAPTQRSRNEWTASASWENIFIKPNHPAPVRENPTSDDTKELDNFLDSFKLTPTKS